MTDFSCRMCGGTEGDVRLVEHGREEISEEWEVSDDGETELVDCLVGEWTPEENE